MSSSNHKSEIDELRKMKNEIETSLNNKINQFSEEFKKAKEIKLNNSDKSQLNVTTKDYNDIMEIIDNKVILK